MSCRNDPSNPNSGPGAGTPCDSTVQTCPLEGCEFEARIISVTWDTAVKVARQKKTVKTPHWQDGLNVNDGPGSTRAGVYRVKGKGSHDVAVEIEVTKSKNCSGPAALTGRIPDVKGTGPELVVEGSCPVSVGIHTVNAKIKDPPDKIKWYRGDMAWGLEVPDCKTQDLGRTRIEVFVIHDMPIAAFQSKKGVWVEALRFVCEKVDVQDINKPEDSAEKITKYLHGSHGLRYHTMGGAPHYSVGHGGGTFDLDKYLKTTSTIVNCYDQTAAVQTLGGALGIKGNWLFIMPFGYMEKTDLVGIGQCNNPFYPMTGTTPVVGVNDAGRTGFGNHAFCEVSSKIDDACAGPHAGTETRAQYVDTAIAKTTDTTLYASTGTRPGTVADITVLTGVTDVR